MATHARVVATALLLFAFAVVIPAQQSFDTSLRTAPSRVEGQNPPPPAPAPPQQQTPPPPAGQQPPPDQTPPDQPPTGGQRPVIRTGINFVSVDVIVTDKKSGDVVLDLKQDDFEVKEDKKPQRVETFDVVKIDPLVEAAKPVHEIRSTEDEETEAKQPNVRLFIILLDDYHVRRGSDLASRKPLIDFVENQLGPQDMPRNGRR